jgi:hypothetical protein
MKILSLILAAGLLFSGCATYKHSEYIDTDQLEGYASGKYSNSSGGPSGSFVIAGSGGAVGGGSSGFGLGAIAVNSGPPGITPYSFARAVTMINYSKKLKSIKYDEAGGIVEYEFNHQALPKRTSYLAPGNQSGLPPSFGHQPVE